jgi:hypothetical protein
MSGSAELSANLSDEALFDILETYFQRKKKKIKKSGWQLMR